MVDTEFRSTFSIMERNSSQELDTVTGDDEDDFYAADHRSVLNRTITIFCYVCIHVVCLVGKYSISDMFALLFLYYLYSFT